MSKSNWSIILKTFPWFILLYITFAAIFSWFNAGTCTMCVGPEPLDPKVCGCHTGFGLTSDDALAPLVRWAGFLLSFIVSAMIIPGIPLLLNKRAQKKSIRNLQSKAICN